MTGAGSRPPRGYAWAPFTAGHTVTLHHGAYSPRTWRPLADTIAAELPEVAPWCCRPAFGPTVSAWARTEAQLQLVMVWLDEVGPLDEEGTPRPATALLSRLEGQAQSLRSEMGLSPLSLARLLSTFATATAAGGDDDDALDQLKAEGRRIVEARSAALEAAPSPTPPTEGEPQ